MEDNERDILKCHLKSMLFKLQAANSCVADCIENLTNGNDDKARDNFTQSYEELLSAQYSKDNAKKYWRFLEDQGKL